MSETRTLQFSSKGDPRLLNEIAYWIAGGEDKNVSGFIHFFEDGNNAGLIRGLCDAGINISFNVGSNNIVTLSDTRLSTLAILLDMDVPQLKYIELASTLYPESRG